MMLKLANILLLCACLMYVSAKPTSCVIPTCYVHPCNHNVCPDQGTQNTCQFDDQCPCQSKCVPLRVEEVFQKKRAIPDECPQCVVNPCQLCTEGQFCKKHPKCSCKDKCVSLDV